jgi:hypothetical protein
LIHNKKYSPINVATFGYRLFREHFVATAALAVDTAYTDAAMIVDFTGYARQAFKVLPIHAGGGTPTVEVEIQEFLPTPGYPNDGDPANGTWATKSGLGVGVAQPNDLFEHNQEDTMRLARLVVTPKSSVVDGGIKIEMSGRIDT